MLLDADKDGEGVLRRRSGIGQGGIGLGSFQRYMNTRSATSVRPRQRHSHSKFEVLCVRRNDAHFLSCRSVMHSLRTGRGERNTADQDILADSAGLQAPRKQRATTHLVIQDMGRRTYDCTKDVALVWVLVTHTEVGEDGCPILSNRRIVHSLDLVELVGMHQIERGRSDELVRFET